MADDIVTRLREQTQLGEWDSDCLHPMIALGREAADEIERLRNLGDALAYAIDKLDGFLSPDKDVVLRVERTLDAWKEARRG